MRVAIPKETRPGETRVAATPESIKKLKGLGLDIIVQAGAGAGAKIADADYLAAGATIAPDAAATVRDADIVLMVRGPQGAEIANIRRGAVVAALLSPHTEQDNINALASAGITAFAMEFLPRISRAQAMDVLSSQANLAGYKAVIDAAAQFGRAFPMMMTAAGTVPPAKAFIMGVGVAGLQAIATARRLGAIVSATDVRKATEEQVKSLGAKFVFADVADAATAGGYARELSAEDKAKQAALIADHIKAQDIVITTALIPGRPAPVLVTQEMVETMKPGSVIVDLAVERGGNCPLSKPGEIVIHKGVTIMGNLNLAGRLAGNASPLYARNLQNFLDPLIKDGALKIDWADEIITGTLVAKDGELVHKMFKS